MACEDVLENYMIMLDHDFDGHDNNHDVALIMTMSTWLVRKTKPFSKKLDSTCPRK